MILTLNNATITNDLFSWDVFYIAYKIKSIRISSSLTYLVTCYNEDVRQLVLMNTLTEGDADIVYNTTTFTVSFRNVPVPNRYASSNITELEIELIEA